MHNKNVFSELLSLYYVDRRGTNKWSKSLRCVCVRQRKIRKRLLRFKCLRWYTEKEEKNCKYVAINNRFYNAGKIRNKIYSKCSYKNPYTSSQSGTMGFIITVTLDMSKIVFIRIKSRKHTNIITCRPHRLKKRNAGLRFNQREKTDLNAAALLLFI